MTTLQEIANRLHLNVSVISRALNPNPDKYAVVKAETRDLIRRTAQEMGYRPNRYASFLKKGKNPSILCFLPDMANDLIANLMFGISEAASQELFPVNFVFGHKAEDFHRFLTEAQTAGNSGLISYPPQIMSQAMQHEVKDYMEQGGNILLLNVTSNTPHSGEVPRGFEEVPQLNVDDYYGGSLMATHFIEQGCKQFYYVFPRENFYTARCNGFTQTLAKQSLCAEIVQYLDPDILRNAPGKVGVFCSNDMLAINWCNQLQCWNMKPGEKILLGGFNDMHYARDYSIGITSVHQPMRETGNRAVHKIIQMIFNRKETNETMKPTLVVRESSTGIHQDINL